MASRRRTLSRQKVVAFQNLIFDWFATHQRDLPWRQTHDPYGVLVSEVMLQQTQVERVLKYYRPWLVQWPTFAALAAAPTAEVIRAWAGLGYNRRAVNLQRAARFVIEAGGFERFRTIQELSTIPGVGAGTAGALMNFVWNSDTPFLEVNIQRILQRLTFGPEMVVGWASDKELLAVARAVLPAGQARIWPHALMDFGALACKPSDPFCEKCPLSGILAPLSLRKSPSASSGHFRSIPVAKTRPKFEETNRYWRGRIVDVLRQAPAGLPSDELYARLPTTTRLELTRYKQILVGLEADGLLVSARGKVELGS